MFLDVAKSEINYKNVNLKTLLTVQNDVRCREGKFFNEKKNDIIENDVVFTELFCPIVLLRLPFSYGVLCVLQGILITGSLLVFINLLLLPASKKNANF